MRRSMNGLLLSGLLVGFTAVTQLSLGSVLLADQTDFPKWEALIKTTGAKPE